MSNPLHDESLTLWVPIRLSRALSNEERVSFQNTCHEAAKKAATKWIDENFPPSREGTVHCWREGDEKTRCCGKTILELDREEGAYCVNPVMSTCPMSGPGVAQFPEKGGTETSSERTGNAFDDVHKMDPDV